MDKIIMTIERSEDLFDAYSENCEGIYAAGTTIEELKLDTEKAISLIKKNLPENRWPEQIKGDYTIEFKLDVQSFLDYYGSIISLAGLEKITGVNQKQLSNYLHHRAVPRRKQIDRISSGLRKFANELQSIML